MKQAFLLTQADFSGIARTVEPLYIRHVLHSAFIIVDEKGTEAGAATVVGFGYSAAAPPMQFLVDHPFVYLIRDTRTGTILFIGRVANPKE